MVDERFVRLGVGPCDGGHVGVAGGCGRPVGLGGNCMATGSGGRCSSGWDHGRHSWDDCGCPLGAALGPGVALLGEKAAWVDQGGATHWEEIGAEVRSFTERCHRGTVVQVVGPRFSKHPRVEQMLGKTHDVVRDVVEGGVARVALQLGRPGRMSLCGPDFSAFSVERGPCRPEPRCSRRRWHTHPQSIQCAALRWVFRAFAGATLGD